ncbi:MAG: hypothetical protein Q4D38_11215 [Planctomycetia bacterium]|nr:hypothetical protein [Planctomycetia bacterium]
MANNVRTIITLENFPIYRAGCYGNKRASTPGLDEFSLKCTLFDRAYTLSCDGLATLATLWDSFGAQVPSFCRGKNIFVTDDEGIGTPKWFNDAYFASPTDFFSESRPLGDEASGEASDEAFLWAHFHVWTLDELDQWLQLPGVQDSILAILGVSGETPAEVDTLLYHAEVQLPWWIRFSKKKFEATRCHSLVSPEDFRLILEKQDPDAQFRSHVRIEDAPRWAIATDEWFLTGLDETPEEAHPGTLGGTYSDTLDEARWMELYHKPHDWWEQNDVRSRCADVVEELLSLRR